VNELKILFWVVLVIVLLALIGRVTSALVGGP